jgi:hypothetical protein
MLFHSVGILTYLAAEMAPAVRFLENTGLFPGSEIVLTMLLEGFCVVIIFALL